MLWLWILLGIAALLALLGRMPAGVLAEFDGETAVELTIGPFHKKILPAPARDKSKEKKSQKAGKAAKREKSGAKSGGRFPKPTLADVRQAYRELHVPVGKALRRLGRGIRIDPLRLEATLGGRDDPAEAAELYGYAEAAVWTFLPALEQCVNIPAPSVSLRVDFDRAQSFFKGSAGISLRVGTLAAVAFSAGIPVLKWLGEYRRRKRTEPPKTEAPSNAAA